ncbi:exonuclease domain-containing protein [Eubacterium ventriosum]|jgi:DNA polymerase-3 subunit epsilon|uniref:exonuclease domain-containing protein n=1 Tax=Eubacterium ventriosum TaxID=39496 RepID=UPI003520317E
MVKDYVCVDIETSGVRVKWDKIIEIGAVKVRDSKVVDTFSELINPGLKLSPYITELTGITDEMLKDKPFIEKVLPRFIEFTGDDVIMGHNIMFDYSFLKQNAINQKLKFDKMGIDTLKIARKTLKGLESRGLEYLCNYYGIADENHHRAFNDAEVTSKLYNVLMEKFGTECPGFFEPYQLVFKAKKMQPITDRQKKYLKDLMVYHKIEINFNIDELSKNEASKKIDKILSEKGRIFD